MRWRRGSGRGQNRENDGAATIKLYDMHFMVNWKCIEPENERRESVSCNDTRRYPTHTFEMGNK